MNITKNVNLSTYVDDVKISIVDEDVDIDIDIDDVIDFIEQASTTELNQIIDALKDEKGGDISLEIDPEFITFDNLHDREKVLILKELNENLTLTDLQDLIKNHTYIRR